MLRVEASGRRLVPVNGLAGPKLMAAVASLSTLLRVPALYRGKRLEVQQFRDEPAARSEAADALAKAGFEESGDAMISGQVEQDDCHRFALSGLTTFGDRFENAHRPTWATPMMTADRPRYFGSARHIPSTRFFFAANSSSVRIPRLWSCASFSKSSRSAPRAGPLDVGLK
jgi:hypothetical protein